MTAQCLVCRRAESVVVSAAGFDGAGVECARCGSYQITREATMGLALTDAERGRLSGFLRHRAIRGEPEVVFVRTRDAVVRPLGVTIGDALATVPRTVGAISDSFLVALSRLASSPGDEITLGEDFTPLVYSLKPDDLWWHVHQLNSRGLVVSEPGDTSHQLSHAGWERVETLQRGENRDSHQAFVAMWFDASMDAAYEQGIAPAIRDAGFDAYRIKDVEHNNKICDEILAEIRRSRFVVAEFTGDRGGVYFEAGFAMGLGLPVVWVVQEEDLKRVHFDTNHFNHVTWADVSELKTKLQRRIAATIPRPIRS